MSQNEAIFGSAVNKKNRTNDTSGALQILVDSTLQILLGFFKLHQMASLVTLSAPLNQGSFGSCAGYAFAKALANGVLGKYAVPLDVMEVLGAVKLLCPCWEG